MGVVGLQGAHSALKTFKRSGNAADLRRLAAQLNETCGLTLRLGNRILHDAGTGQISEALFQADLPPKTLGELLDKIVEWYRTHDRMADWSFNVDDLKAVAARNINLSRDLDQLAEANELIATAKILKDMMVTLTLGGREVHTFGFTSAGKAELLVGLRAICGPKGITVREIIQKAEAIGKSGLYQIENMDIWTGPVPFIM